MNNKEKRDRRNKYMAEYKKDKISHYIALNESMTEKEKFLFGDKEKGIEPRINKKYNEVYEAGLNFFMDKYKKNSNRLEYQRQELLDKKHELQKELAKIDIDLKDINREIKKQNETKMNLRLKSWINKDIKPLFEEFKKKNKDTDYKFKDFYFEYKTKIWSTYSNSNYEDEKLDNNLMDDTDQDERMIDVLIEKLDYTFKS